MVVDPMSSIALWLVSGLVTGLCLHVTKSYVHVHCLRHVLHNIVEIVLLYAVHCSVLARCITLWA